MQTDFPCKRSLYCRAKEQSASHSTRSDPIDHHPDSRRSQVEGGSETKGRKDDDGAEVGHPRLLSGTRDAQAEVEDQESRRW